MSLENINWCQNAGCFSLNKAILATPNNPDNGVYIWKIDSGPAGLTKAEIGFMLKDMDTSIWKQDIRFCPLSATFPITSSAATKEIGEYEIKFCYMDTTTACTTCDFSYITIEKAPQVIFSPFPKLCYSDDTIYLNQHVNLPGGRWELKAFNGFTATSPQPSRNKYLTAKAKMIDSTAINIMDTVEGLGGTFTWRYVSSASGCSVKDSIDIIVNAKPLLGLNDRDTLCFNNNVLDLLSLISVPSAISFKNSGPKTGWRGLGVQNNSFFPSLAVSDNPTNLNTSTIELTATYQNPSTMCLNEAVIDVVLENKININKGYYRIGDYLYANDPDAQYQWVNCDRNFEPILGENARKFTPKSIGNFAVVLTYGNCNSNTGRCYDYSNVGINTLDNSSLQITPNPVTESFRLSLPNEQLTRGQVRIYNS